MCGLQPQPAPARQQARVYPRQVVWWATPVEALSAFQRLTREGQLTNAELRQALPGLNTSERVGAKYNHQKMRDKPPNVFWRDISFEQPTHSNLPRH